MQEQRVGRRTFITAIATGVLVAVLGAGALVTSRPTFCGSCHAMSAAADGHAAGAHRSVGCYRCHARGPVEVAGFKLFELTAMYPSLLREATLTAAARPVADSACIVCHQGLDDGIQRARGVAVRHSTCAAEQRCGACHTAAAHGRGVRIQGGPWMDECVRCHLSRSATVECDVCHEGRREKDRLARGPWQVTHGPAWRTTHGMGELALCRTCHEPEKCVRCHGLPMPHPDDFGVQHGREAKRIGRARCTSCHDAAAFCDACHTLPMPHPVGFLRRHSTEARSPEDHRCLRCHEERSCEWCHEKHVHPGGARPPREESRR